MRQRGRIDCLILAVAGPSLIRSILDNATVPYVIDGDGNCHVYVDDAADLDMAGRIIVNAKTQRPSVCNAAESLLVHAVRWPASSCRGWRLALGTVELVGDATTQAIAAIGRRRHRRRLRHGVPRPEEAVGAGGRLDRRGHRAHRPLRLGSQRGHRHADAGGRRAVLAEVDAAAVLVNASTRFIDGEELGLGAEIGISTQKLHARGPMGLQQLTTAKFIVGGRARSSSDLRR